MTSDRRSFLASVGASVATGLVWDGCTPAARAPIATPRAGSPTLRGLVPADDLLIDPELAYVQTGSLGPTPRPVMERAIAVWRELERDPTGLGYGTLEQGMETVRSKAAALLGCGLHEPVITTSTTEGINWVAQGVSLAAGDRILTTDQEHPGGRVGWDFVAKRYGATIDVVAIPPGENDAAAVIERFARLVTPRTRVLSFSHVLTSTGLRMPVVELADLARRANAISIVDGAQAAGGIAVDVKQLGCDVYATSGHKWLLGERHRRALPERRARGPHRADRAAGRPRRLLALRRRVQHPERSRPRRGDRLRHRARHRAHRGARSRAASLRVRRARRTSRRCASLSVRDGALASPLLTYTLPAPIDAWAIVRQAARRSSRRGQGRAARVAQRPSRSTHAFNDERDIDRLVAALHAELR